MFYVYDFKLIILKDCKVFKKMSMKLRLVVLNRLAAIDDSIISLLYHYYTLLYLIQVISWFSIPISRSLQTPILVLCAQQ